MDIRKISADIYKTHKVSGKSFKYNNFVQNGNFVDTSGWHFNGGTFSASNNELVITYNVEPSNHGPYTEISLTQNHKYISLLNLYSSISNTIGIGVGSSNFFYPQVSVGWNTIGYIITNANDTNTAFYVRPNYSGVVQIGDVFKLSKVIIIDLTQVFGAGNEPTTLEQFYATDLGKAIQNGWYPTYTTGAIYNAKSPFVFSGRNLWNEQCELGSFNIETGNNQVTQSQIRVKNLIEVKPNTSYSMRWFCRINDAKCFGMFLDENQNVVSKDNWGNDLYGVGNVRRICYTQGIYAYSTTFTSPTNAKYFKWYFTAEYGTTYKNDVCFQLSTETNTNYVPYTHNELTRTGKVDLGSLNWQKLTDESYYGTIWYAREYNNHSISNMKKFSFGNSNCLCQQYKTNKTNNWNYSNKTIGSGCNFISESDLSINIKDTELNNKTAQEVKSLLNNVFLEYETNEPMELRSVNAIKDTYENASGKKDIFFNEKDLGTLDWQYITGEGSYPFFRASLIGAKTQKLFPRSLPNSITYKYTCRNDEDITIGGYDKCFAIAGATGNEKIMIRDSAYTDLSSFVSAINGQKLIYELANPTTETHGTIMLSKNITKCVDSNGIELDIE